MWYFNDSMTKIYIYAYTYFCKSLVKDLRNLNFSLLCKVFLKLRKFTNHMITAVETWYFCLAKPIIFLLRGWQPWHSVISYNIAVRLTLLQCNYKCFHLQKY